MTSTDPRRHPQADRPELLELASAGVAIASVLAAVLGFWHPQHLPDHPRPTERSAIASAAEG
jgi:hypothetical protein